MAASQWIDLLSPDHISASIAAVGGLGTASAGIVDVLKSLPRGGISRVGFAGIGKALAPFLGAVTEGVASSPLETLHGNWINGRPLDDQKAIAKSLIKVRLNQSNASQWASGVDASINATELASAVAKMNPSGSTVAAATIGGGASGTIALTPTEQNAYGRWDLALTALIDGAYQHADQEYRNTAKILAGVFAVALAVATGASTSEWSFPQFVQSVIAGLLATPLAPIAKDLASAIQAGTKAAQGLVKQ